MKERQIKNKTISVRAQVAIMFAAFVVVVSLSFGYLVWYQPGNSKASGSCGFGTDNGSGVCVGTITSGTTWTVPSDWNNSNNSIEAIGAGGNGANASASIGGAGGGGGEYREADNVSLTPSAAVDINISSGGDGSAAAGTWIKNGAGGGGTIVVEAKNGGNGSGVTAGAGGTGGTGAAANFNGGAGGAGDSASTGSGAGGGGSAGPSGIGKAGGNGITSSSGAGGGGGSDGGSSTVGGTPSSSAGASGGAGTAGTGAGSAGTSNGSNAGVGTNGGGGGGSGNATGGTAANGGGGGTENLWAAGIGPSGGGGGGGGGSTSASGSRNGGVGGTYGGGGGGGGNASSVGTGGTGGQGVIFISYTPVVAPPVTYATTSAVTLSTFGTSTVGLGWYSSGGTWTYRKRITINHAQVSGASSLTNFPVLISRVNSDLKSTGNGGNVGKSDGTDILFTASDGTTKLNHEIESYSPTTGALTAWVNIPSLSPSADTVIYMYYGNASASDQQNVSSVWSGYSGVWHLDDASGTTKDSTSNATNGTVTGSPYGATGLIGTAYNFNGSSYVDFGDPADGHLDFSAAQSFTFSVWIDTTTHVNNYRDVFYKGGSNNFTPGWSIEFNNTDDRFYSQLNDGSTEVGSAFITSVPQWTLDTVVINRSANTMNLYANGVLQSSVSISALGTLATTLDLSLGAQAGGSFPYTGLIDEARVASSALSADWIATEYNNQSSPSAFVSVGGAETPTRTVPGSPSTAAPALKIRGGVKFR